MSARGNLGSQWVKAEDVQVGDRLDIMGRTRVSKVHVRGDQVLHATKHLGQRSGSVQSKKVGEDVRVYRPKS